RHPLPHCGRGVRTRALSSGFFGGLQAAAFAVALLSLPPALACDFDHAATSRWTIVKEGGAQWLKTPCGEPFYSLGVNILDGGYPDRERDGKTYYSWKAFASSVDDWAAETRNRLDRWGFNSAGGWSLPAGQLRLPE